MRWNNLPYWLRGGLMGFIGALYMFVQYNFEIPSYYFNMPAIRLHDSFQGIGLILCGFWKPACVSHVARTAASLFLVLAGVLLGWIYGRARSHSQ